MWRCWKGERAWSVRWDSEGGRQEAEREGGEGKEPLVQIDGNEGRKDRKSPAVSSTRHDRSTRKQTWGSKLRQWGHQGA